MIKVLFVCLGNICRSPVAEEIFRVYIHDIGLSKSFQIDSAGLINSHEGETPDRRMCAHAFRRGYKLTSHSRPITYDDFFAFDYIIGMDDTNIERLRQLSPTDATTKKIHKLVDFIPLESGQRLVDHVPDPYYGGAEGFELVLDLVQASCPHLLEQIKQDYPQEFN